MYQTALMRVLTDEPAPYFLFVLAKAGCSDRRRDRRLIHNGIRVLTELEPVLGHGLAAVKAKVQQSIGGNWVEPGRPC